MPEAALLERNGTTPAKRKGEHLAPYRFQAGNPGRPKGSRNRLGEKFIDDLHEAWQTHGAEVISAVIRDKPEQFLKVIAAVIPQEINHRVEDHEQLSDEELYTAVLRGAEEIRARARTAAGMAPQGAIEGSATQLPD